MKIPYTQQFTPKATPLRRLLGIVRQHQGNPGKLQKAIGKAFFGETNDPDGMARNTLIALKYHNILDTGCNPTADLGIPLIDAKPESAAVEILAKNILLNFHGVILVETLREMKQGGLRFNLGAITEELRLRGFEASSNSSDLSGVLGWLREADVLAEYEVNEQRYAELVGATAQVVEALKDLSEGQIAFLRAMVALNISDWTPHNVIVQHAESVFTGQASFNWKDLDRQILQPLTKVELIEFRKAAKSAPSARGGKSAEVRPTPKFENEVAEPILKPLYEAAGYKDIRRIRSIPLATLVANIRQKDDDNLRGESLEILAIRVCQLLGLDFMGWRETDEEIVAGGEVDGFMHSARLIYSRWQVQCKASDKISYETLAKEVGVSEVTLANVILIVSTGAVTEGAAKYRQRIISKSPLNIAIIDGAKLDAIVANPALIGDIMQAQALDAMQAKPKPTSLIRKTQDDGDSGEGTGWDDNGGGDSGGDVGGSGGPESLPDPVAEQSPPVESATANCKAADRPDSQKPLFDLAYSTPHGSMYCGDAYDVLQFLIQRGVRVKLLFTSPPFALIRKKEYGNEDQERYVAWFMRFAPLFREILEPGGSFVMDIGGSWLPGLPARSVYQYKLLLRLCESGFYLAQEFFHYNPAKLPTPAEWVTVRRLRVKDAINNVWWFVKEPFVDSDNRRVLRAYSESMKGLIRNGYKAKKRPSGHDISAKFQKDNGGAIPPNLLEFANTDSNGHYLQACKQAGIKPHPARFPAALPDFFIRFLTQPGDVVLDPFAGSNVTGEAAEGLERRWLACEISDEYIAGSRFRFAVPATPSKRDRPAENRALLSVTR
jgi:DNA modification methylase